MWRIYLKDILLSFYLEADVKVIVFILWRWFAFDSELQILLKPAGKVFQGELLLCCPGLPGPTGSPLYMLYFWETS